MNPLINNPQQNSNKLNEILSMIGNRDPQQVFMEECKKRGLDENAINGILNMAKNMR